MLPPQDLLELPPEHVNGGERTLETGIPTE